MRVVILGAFLLSTVACGARDSRAEIHFHADYLFLDRDSNVDNGGLISGPNAVSANSVDFNFQSGYRFGLEVFHNDWSVEAVFSRIDEWNAFRSGVLVDALTLDDTVNSAFYGGSVPHNRYALPNALYHAATNNDPFDDLSGTDDETLEAEFLLPLSNYEFVYTSQLDDFELTFKSPYVYQRARFGVGYRGITLNEMSALTVMGTLDTVDSATGLELAANDGLSHQALIASGLTLLSGVGNGWDDENAAPLGPDVLILSHTANADNRLSGINFTYDVAVCANPQWMLDYSMKVGVFHNRVRGVVSETYTGVTNDDSQYGRTFSNARDTVAFAGNIGLQGTYIVNDYLRVRAGYDVLFLAGVALAPDQYHGVTANGPDATYSVQSDGQLVAHGGNVGLEVVW